MERERVGVGVGEENDSPFGPVVKVKRNNIFRVTGKGKTNNKRTNRIGCWSA